MTPVEAVDPVVNGQSPHAFFRGARRRYIGLLLSGVWLVFLVPVVVAAAGRGGLRDWLGVAVVLAFSGCYLAAASMMRSYFRSGHLESSGRFGRVILAALVGLSGATMLLLGADGVSTTPYLAVIGVMVFRRWGPLWVLGLAAVVEVLARGVPGWQHLDGIGFSALGAGFAMWGVVLMVQRNAELIRTREAEAELAVESERNRFGRDLHDILGHSLTVITVKAELAGRLLEIDPERARAEVADLERLARDALGDVRRTVEGYREITLAGELARARAALAAAGIDADVSSAAEIPSTELRELFAWTVREGVTNVLRHSGARHCAVLLEPTSVTVRDDGDGSPEEAVTGHGLLGLRERATTVGARVITTSLEPRGFALTVTLATSTPASYAAPPPAAVSVSPGDGGAW